MISDNEQPQPEEVQQEVKPEARPIMSYMHELEGRVMTMKRENEELKNENAALVEFHQQGLDHIKQLLEKQEELERHVEKVEAHSNKVRVEATRLVLSGWSLPLALGALAGIMVEWVVVKIWG